MEETNKIISSKKRGIYWQPSAYWLLYTAIKSDQWPMATDLLVDNGQLTDDDNDNLWSHKGNHHFLRSRFVDGWLIMIDRNGDVGSPMLLFVLMVGEKKLALA